MIFFPKAKPKVTQDEYKKLRNELYSQGFTSKELAYVDEIVGPHLADRSVYDTSAPGIDAHEVKEIEEQLAEPDPHKIYSVKLPEHKKVLLQNALEKYLKK